MVVILQGIPCSGFSLVFSGAVSAGPYARFRSIISPFGRFPTAPPEHISLGLF